MSVNFAFDIQVEFNISLNRNLKQSVLLNRSWFLLLYYLGIRGRKHIIFLKLFKIKYELKQLSPLSNLIQHLCSMRKLIYHRMAHCTTDQLGTIDKSTSGRSWFIGFTSILYNLTKHNTLNCKQYVSVENLATVYNLIR